MSPWKYRVQGRPASSHIWVHCSLLVLLTTFRFLLRVPLSLIGSMRGTSANLPSQLMQEWRAEWGTPPSSCESSEALHHSFAIRPSVTRREHKSHQDHPSILHNHTMPENAEDRSSLVNRQLPEMVLSTADNPLTAPRPPPDNLSAAQRTAYRFQVKGNAIST
jgi:hypothetical protein